MGHGLMRRWLLQPLAQECMTDSVPTAWVLTTRPCAALCGHCAGGAHRGAPHCQLCGLLTLQRNLQHQPLLQAVRTESLAQLLQSIHAFLRLPPRTAKLSPKHIFVPLHECSQEPPSYLHLGHCETGACSPWICYQDHSWTGTIPVSRCLTVSAPLRRWGIDGSDPKMGDTHFYNYGSDCTDVRFYPRSKFVSEFGTQSYPSFSVLRNVTAPSDWAYDSAMSNYRCGWRRPPCHSYLVHLVVQGDSQCMKAAHADASYLRSIGVQYHVRLCTGGRPAPSACEAAQNQSQCCMPQAATRQRQPAAGGANGARVQGAGRQGGDFVQCRAGRHL